MYQSKNKCFLSFSKVSSQPCPEGQQGDATWLCGTDGDWVGLPDLTQCRVLNTDAVIDELKVKSNTGADPRYSWF